MLSFLVSLLTWNIFEYLVSYFLPQCSLLQRLFVIASEMIQIYKMSTRKSTSWWKSYFTFQMKILYLQVSSATVKDASKSKSHMKPTTTWLGNTEKHACCFEATQPSCFHATHKRYSNSVFPWPEVCILACNWCQSIVYFKCMNFWADWQRFVNVAFKQHQMRPTM